MGLREFTSVPADPREWGRWMRAQFITADSVAPNTITTGMIVDGQVTFAKIQDVAALSVFGRPVNSAGVGSAIAAPSDGDVLRRLGLTLGFGSILAASVSDFSEAAQDAVGLTLTDTSSIDFTYNDGAGTISAVVLPAGVDHDALANSLANEHVDHTSVTLTAGAGLTGGGDISASRSLAVGAGTGISVAADSVAVDLTATFPWTGPHSWDEQIQVVPGSAGTPSIASTGDTNTGIFWNGGDILSFACNGSVVFALTTTIFRVVTQIQTNDGNAGAPSHSFDNDPDCGMFRQGVNAVGISSNAVEVARFDASSTAGQTRFLVFDVDNNTLERVTVGAADSGGAGFKVLRIPN